LLPARNSYYCHGLLAVADWRELVQAERTLGTGHALLNPEGEFVS
jgi:hypothetical protein